MSGINYVPEDAINFIIKKTGFDYGTVYCFEKLAACYLDYLGLANNPLPIITEENKQLYPSQADHDPIVVDNFERCNFISTYMMVGKDTIMEMLNALDDYEESIGL